MSELNELAQLLRAKTAEGKLQWRLEGEARITSKQGENLIEISEIIADAAYTLTLRNKNGLMLATDSFQTMHPQFASIRDTFAQVRRLSLGVDEALTDVKQRLLSL